MMFCQSTCSGGKSTIKRWPSLPLLVLCLLWLHLPQAQAFYGVEVSITNDCVDTVEVSLNDGSFYTLDYGESYTWTLCESWCTGSWGSEKSYGWSYEAYASDCPYDSEWSNSGSVSVDFWSGGETEYRSLSCDDSSCPVKKSSYCCNDYSNSDYDNDASNYSAGVSYDYECVSSCPREPKCDSTCCNDNSNDDYDNDYSGYSSGARSSGCCYSCGRDKIIKPPPPRPPSPPPPRPPSPSPPRPPPPRPPPPPPPAPPNDIEADTQGNSISPSTTPSSSSSSSSNIGAIVGGVIAGVAVVALAIGAVFIIRRRQPNDKKGMVDGKGVNYDSNNYPPTMPNAKMMAVGVNPNVDPMLSWMSTSVLGENITWVRAADEQLGPELQPYLIPFQQLHIEGPPVGEGSFGRVFKGSYNGQDVAVKVLLEAASVNRQADQTALRSAAIANPLLEKLRQEASFMIGMNHPHIIRFIGVCSVPPAIITEFCSNGSVYDVLSRGKQDPEGAAGSSLTWARRLGFALDAAEGLAFLHGQDAPIVHRDLKSNNLLVDEEYQVKVCDFNLSKLMDSDSARSSSIAAMNPRWLANEILGGAKPDQSADVFAFGVILWEILTWEMPWAAHNPWTIVSGVMSGQRLSIPPVEHLPGPDNARFGGIEEYVALVQRCWDQDKEARPQFPEICADLRRLLADLEI